MKKIDEKKQEYFAAVQDALMLEDVEVADVKQDRTIQEVRINRWRRNFRLNAEM